MRCSILINLLPLLPAVLALDSTPLLKRLDTCFDTELACGTGCIPSGYTCCDDKSGGCPETSKCKKNPSGTTACCPDGLTCKDSFDFFDTEMFDKTNHVGGDPAEVTATGAAASSILAAATSAAVSASASASAAASSASAGASKAAASGSASASKVAASSTGAAPKVTEAAGLVLALGAGMAMLL